MNNEVKICQNCKYNFTIESEDFDFYKKIEVPPPTWCPECRTIRRMMWRNTRNLYKRPCDAEGHNDPIISVFSPEKDLVVYCPSCWWSQKHDPLVNGKPYDFSRPFFEQFTALLRVTPLPSLSSMNSVDSDYVNMTVSSKSCYLVFSSSFNEHCSYSEGINECRDSMDLLASRKSEHCYRSTDCTNCFNVLFSAKATNCSDSGFLYDCRNCSKCFGCWNLRNKQYCILNKQYDKESYEKELARLDIGSYARLSEFKKIFEEQSRGVIHRFADIFHSENVSGNGIESSHNCHYSFDIVGNADSKYVWRILDEGGTDNYDITVATKPTLAYEGQGAGFGHGSKFSLSSGDTSYSHYTHSCISGCSYNFGCVGLTNKQYCILNKQYTKEEYEALVPKIIAHMNEMPYIDAKGRVYPYGEYFPPELSPLRYNETMAQEYYPLTKEEALSKGYTWRDPDVKTHTITKRAEDLSDHIRDVDDSILAEAIGCAHGGKCMHQCTVAFRVIPSELQFYRKANPARPDDISGRSGGLPLPRLCPNCRHYERLAQRNPLKLWHRKCMKDGCVNEFETSYAPERPEVVYCEQCYQKEVI